MVLLKVNDDILRDRIVVGISDDNTRHKLLAEPHLTMESAVKMCCAEEAARQTGDNMTTPSSANALRRSAYKQQKFKSQPVASQPPSDKPHTTDKPKCPNCGRTKHTKSSKTVQQARSFVVIAVSLAFMSMCPKLSKSRKPKEVGHLKLQRTEHSDAATVAIGTRLCTEALPTSLQWIPDTGSDIDAIGIRQLSAIGDFTENLATDLDDVRTASGDQLVSVGTIDATLTAGSSSHNTIIHVYKGLDDALLSRQSLRALGFIPPDWPKQVARIAQSHLGPLSSRRSAKIYCLNLQTFLMIQLSSLWLALPWTLSLSPTPSLIMYTHPVPSRTPIGIR